MQLLCYSVILRITVSQLRIKIISPNILVHCAIYDRVMSLKEGMNGSTDPEIIATATLGSSPVKRDKRAWTAEEDEALMLAVLDIKQKKGTDENEDDDEDWDEIAESVPDRTAFQCYQRYIRYLHKPSASRMEDLEMEATTKRDNSKDKGTQNSKKMSTRAKAGNLKDDTDYDDQADVGKRKRGTSSETVSKKSSPKEPSSSKKKAAQPETSSSSRDASPSKWTTEETQLLKKLVEQYQDGKFFIWIIAFRVITFSIIILFAVKPRLVGMMSPIIFLLDQLLTV